MAGAVLRRGGRVVVCFVRRCFKWTIRSFLLSSFHFMLDLGALRLVCSYSVSLKVFLRQQARGRVESSSHRRLSVAAVSVFHYHFGWRVRLS